MNAFIPETSAEAYALLPQAVQSEYQVTECSHWTACDAMQELASLALTALRACHAHCKQSKLVITDNNYVCVVDKHGNYRCLPAIMHLYTYMSANDVFELLTHSGIAYSMTVHPSYMM